MYVFANIFDKIPEKIEMQELKKPSLTHPILRKVTLSRHLPRKPCKIDLRYIFRTQTKMTETKLNTFIKLKYFLYLQYSFVIVLLDHTTKNRCNFF